MSEGPTRARWEELWLPRRDSAKTVRCDPERAGQKSRIRPWRVGSYAQRTAWLVGLAAIGALGCKNSLSADARMRAELDAAPKADPKSGEAEAAEFDRPLTFAQSERSREVAEGESVLETRALLGARHDVQVKSAAGAVACRCVQALLGLPTMTQLEWREKPPTIQPDTQLLIALVPEADCPGAPNGTQGGSYWGYRISGNDVVVVLEPWRPEPRRPGKPVPPRTTVAIIPKPPAGGSVYLAPLSKSLPFGAPLTQKGTRCAIGNPGPARDSPITPEEQTQSFGDSSAGG